jgi:DNA-directed RNA polymerase specialized sigma subunit
MNKESNQLIKYKEITSENDLQSVKDISAYIKSIAPSSVERICINLGLCGIDKDVWLLRYRDRYTIENIAEQLNVSVATINRIIHRLKIMVAIEISQDSD